MRDALETYPQRGQAGADCNGWSVVSDKLVGGGELAAEFKSCVGPAALTINLGQVGRTPGTVIHFTEAADVIRSRRGLLFFSAFHRRFETEVGKDRRKVLG